LFKDFYDMPSDAAKRRAAAKKARSDNKRTTKVEVEEEPEEQEVDEEQQEEQQENGNGNGNENGNGEQEDTETNGNGTSNGTSNGNGKAATNGKTSAKRAASAAAAAQPKVPLSKEELDRLKREARNTTGVLSSHPQARDIHVVNFSLTYHGSELFTDTTLELNHGRAYGLIGPNGAGKSTLLSALGDRDVPIPAHIDIYHVESEIAATDKTALESVLDSDEARKQLEAEAEALASDTSDEAIQLLTDLYERLELLDAATAEMRAASILHGLGFTAAMQKKKTKDFSGGWRMRIALARALFLRPALLLLDEPTNHLDLEACVWLEMELKKYGQILVLISHSQDFLNGVCTNILHLHQKKLIYYSGNYDQFIKTRAELEENQMKKYQSEQNAIADMKDYIARFGHGSAKLARQAQSKEKVLAKMVAAGLTEQVSKDQTVSFHFNACGTLPPPVLMVQGVSFYYPGTDHLIYKDLEFGIDLDSRIALVGPNGAGKSTLLKLLTGDITPTKGQVRRHSHLGIAYYHQHLSDHLDFELSPLEFMQKCFPKDFVEIEAARRAIGRYGLTGKQQVMPIKFLSDGQRSRVCFAWISWNNPHLLLLDEPTNHLDIETIDSLADAINAFDGGLVLVSHDFRLISQVAKEIWVCEKQTINKWNGDISAYKQTLVDKVRREQKDAK